MSVLRLSKVLEILPECTVLCCFIYPDLVTSAIFRFSSFSILTSCKLPAHWSSPRSEGRNVSPNVPLASSVWLILYFVSTFSFDCSMYQIIECLIKLLCTFVLSEPPKNVNDFFYHIINVQTPAFLTCPHSNSPPNVSVCTGAIFSLPLSPTSSQPANINSLFINRVLLQVESSLLSGPFHQIKLLPFFSDFFSSDPAVSSCLCGRRKGRSLIRFFFQQGRRSPEFLGRNVVLK